MELPNAVMQQANAADAISQSLAGEQNAPEPIARPTEDPIESGIPADRWEAKYKTLEGMYRADGQRYRQKNQELEEKLTQMQKELEDLKYQKQLSERKPLVSEEDRNQFGGDMIDMVKRAVEDGLAEKGREYLGKIPNAELESLKRQLEESRAAESERRQNQFVATLTELLPDWKTQNSDKGFLDWLSEPDEFSGVPRQNVLDRASSALDAQAVARVFKAYRAARQQKLNESPLAKQLAPAHSNGSMVPQDTQGKRIWTQQEVEAFYADVVRGKYTKEDATRMEQEIDLAVAEGRIR